MSIIGTIALMFAIGFVITLLGAGLAYGIEALEPAPALVDRVILGIVIGFGLRQVIPQITRFKSGTDFASKRLLPLAIALMGARMDFQVIRDVSGPALVINLLCVPFAFFLTLAIARQLKIDQVPAILVSIGTAICGGSAIVAAAPIIRAKDADTSVSVAAITLFGVLAIFCYPLLGHSLGLSDLQFGIWAGTGIQAVPQVLAAGFAYSDSAGDLALLVKLVRILLLAPFIIGLSLWTAKNGEHQSLGKWTTYVPIFLIGFVVMAILSTSGVLADINGVPIKTICSKLSSFLITMAMVAIGIGTDLKGALRSRVKLLGVAFLSALILGVVSYALIISFT